MFNLTERVLNHQKAFNEFIGLFQILMWGMFLLSKEPFSTIKKMQCKVSIDVKDANKEAVFLVSAAQYVV